MRNLVYPFYINRIFQCTSTIKPYRMDRKGCLQKMASTNQNRKIGNIDKHMHRRRLQVQRGGKRKGGIRSWRQNPINREACRHVYIIGYIFYTKKNQMKCWVAGEPKSWKIATAVRYARSKFRQ